MFAELPSPDTFQAIGWSVVSLAAAAHAFKNIREGVLSMVGKGGERIISPSPLIVREHQEAVTAYQLKELKEATDRSVLDLYNKVNSALTATASLESLSDVQRQQIIFAQEDIKKLYAGKEDRR